MISLDLLIILIFVMPGLIGTGAYRLLTVSSKFEQFDFIVFALFLTFLSLLVALFIPIIFNPDWQVLPFKSFSQLIMDEKKEAFKDRLYYLISTFIFSYKFLWVVLIGLVLGIVITIVKNYGVLFGFLRLIKLTSKTGNLDVWQDFFRKSHKKGAWLVITLKNEDQYIGELVYHSDNPANRELVICKTQRIQHNEDGSIEGVAVSDDLLYLKGDLIEEILYYDESYNPDSKTRTKP